MFWLGLDASPRRAALYGWLFGGAMMGAGVSWVQVSIHQFGLPVYAFSVGVTVLFVLFMALFPALVCYCAARLRLRADIPGAFAFSGLWTLSEWVRGWLLTGFPWLFAGYSQIDSPLAAYAPVFGVLGVSFVLACCGGMLVMLVAPAARTARVPALIAILVMVLGGTALSRIEWSRSAGAPLQATLIQGNIAQSNKWAPEQRELTLVRYRDLSSRHWSSDIIVWPETAVPAFPQEVADFLDELAANAAASNTSLLLGIPTMHPQQPGYLNSVIALGADTARYDKRHLVPFGEYLPLRFLLGPVLDFLTIPMSDFSAGAPDQGAFMVHGHRAGVSICYEDAYGNELRRALPDAALLVNVSNDAWFGDSLAPHQHLEIARMRALEFSRYMLRATNTGVSAIIDHKGRIVTRIPQFTAAATTADLTPRRGATPYALAGHVPVVLLAIIALALPAWRQHRQH